MRPRGIKVLNQLFLIKDRLKILKRLRWLRRIQEKIHLNSKQISMTLSYHTPEKIKVHRTTKVDSHSLNVSNFGKQNKIILRAKTKSYFESKQKKFY